jgi:hypothetical protein
MMYSAKGVPNRLRVDAYRDAVRDSGFQLIDMKPTAIAAREDVDAVRPRLASRFKELSDEDLSWLGFWLVCKKPEIQ